MSGANGDTDCNGKKQKTQQAKDHTAISAERKKNHFNILVKTFNIM